MKITFLFLLLATLHLANGQSILSKSTLEKECYLKKSKQQKTLFWIAGGTGVGLFTIGGIMYMSEFGKGLPGGTGYNEKKSKTGETLMYVGVGLALVSVPFRIAYKKNEKAAASLSLENRRVSYPKEVNIVSSSVPVLSLKINLGK